MKLASSLRPFEVRASYCDGTVERTATVKAGTPEEAAALAVWRGYLPMWFECRDTGLRAHYWNPQTKPMRLWPSPVRVYVVSEDHSCVRMAFGDDPSATVLVEALALG